MKADQYIVVFRMSALRFISNPSQRVYEIVDVAEATKFPSFDAAVKRVVSWHLPPECTVVPLSGLVGSSPLRELRGSVVNYPS